MSSPSDYHSLFAAFVGKHAKTTYVILMKDDRGNVTLLADPGMQQPWSSKNKRLADFHAKECNGEARTWQEAFDILLKANPQFEKELVERARFAAMDVTKQKLDQNSLKHGINTNAHADLNSPDGTILGANGSPLSPPPSG